MEPPDLLLPSTPTHLTTVSFCPPLTRLPLRPDPQPALCVETLPPPATPSEQQPHSIKTDVSVLHCIPTPVVLERAPPRNPQAPLASVPPDSLPAPAPSSPHQPDASTSIQPQPIASSSLAPDLSDISPLEQEPSRPSRRRRRRRESSPQSSNTLAPLRSFEPAPTLDSGGPEAAGVIASPSPDSRPSRKRRRLDSEAMRLASDHVPPDTTSPRAVANGLSPSQFHKIAAARSMNGHAPSDPNTRPPGTTNGVSAHQKPTHPEYFGHDREEITRILIQGLYDLGYDSSAATLVRESGHELEDSAAAAFRNSVLQGEWAEAEMLLFGHDGEVLIMSKADPSEESRGMVLREDANRNEMLFFMRKQKFLELLESRDLGSALQVLRQELAPLSQELGCLPALSSLMMCQSAEDLRARAEWDGAEGQSRAALLSTLSRSISPSVMIPEHRLAVLLQEHKQYQISNCHYHNTYASPSLYSDHFCDRSEFPRRTVLELDDHNGEVWYLQFSHDGTRLATTGADQSIIVYETASYSRIHKLIGHLAGVAHFAWSVDDTRIVSGSQDRTAKIWDMATGKCLVTIDHHRDPVSAVTFYPDGKRFITTSFDTFAPMCLWNLEGELLYTWKREKSFRAQDAAISPDGKRIVAITPTNTIFVYDFHNKEELFSATVSCPRLTCVNISADSQTILINRSDSELQLLDINKVSHVRRFEGYQQGAYVIRSTFGGAGENFVASGSEDGFIYIWHKGNGMLLEKLAGHRGGSVNAVAWHPTDPRFMASAGDDARVRIWAPETSAIAPQFGSASPDGR
ncbi:MAG: hypothetical protein M1814_002906 [Vezdaea aestivalis]|nr:MAG: hypothetical protein M1814_002906 [Vezdaea aestivalis]